MQIEVIKKRFPLLDEEGRPSSYPNFADQVFFDDGEPLSAKSFGISALDVFPVGSVYISVSEASPASLFGGTWEQLPDRFLLGAGGSYSAGATGGAAAHTLTISEMPSHDHNVSKGGNHDTLVMMAGTQNAYGGAGGETGGGAWYWNYGVPAQGGGSAHNNMPPYLAVYMWKRVD